MSNDTLSEQQVEIRILELSEALGFTANTIRWVYCGITILSERKKQQAEEGGPSHISARELCEGLARDIRTLCKKPIRHVLSEMKIDSSRDIGRIVYGLVDNQLINADEHDSVKDFDDLFDKDSLNRFLEQSGIRKSGFDFRRLYKHLMWFLYSVGILLVLGSYFDVVEPRFAWAGWVLGMIGFGMQFVKFPDPERF